MIVCCVLGVVGQSFLVVSAVVRAAVPEELVRGRPKTLHPQYDMFLVHLQHTCGRVVLSEHRYIILLWATSIFGQIKARLLGRQVVGWYRFGWILETHVRRWLAVVLPCPAQCHTDMRGGARSRYQASGTNDVQLRWHPMSAACHARGVSECPLSGAAARRRRNNHVVRVCQAEAPILLHSRPPSNLLT